MERSRSMLAIKLLLSLIICQVPDFIGSIFAISTNNSWYSMLEKPFFTPPDWIFGSIWGIIYILMGISLFLVLIQNDKQKEARIPLIFFAIQLFVNALWTILFFGFKSIFLGLLGMTALFVLVAINVIQFRKINETASLILIPYFLWVAFAAVLSASVFALNM